MDRRRDHPGGLDFRSQSYDPSRNASQMSLGDLPSPRAGEVPPALSPLDQLALQGRLLAKRFEQENKAGRRMSRLAPLTIQENFGNRSGYFHSLNNSTANSPNEELPPVSPGQQPVSSPLGFADKHRSIYPQFGSEEPQQAQHEYALPFRSNLAPIGEMRPVQPAYFDIPRSQSPGAVMGGVQEATPVSPNNPCSDSQPFTRPQQRKQPSLDSLRPQQAGLVPPASSGSLRDRSRDRSPRSIRSVPDDSSSEVEDMSLGGSYDSFQARNLSPSSSMSRAHSPFTTYSNPTIPRSPSMSSEFSAGGTQLPRPAFNFSRPMSSSSRPSMDIRPVDQPMRKNTDESVYTRPSFESGLGRQISNDVPMPNHANDTVHTPVSMTSEDFRRSGDYGMNPAPTYTYSKFSLPRGRKLDRQSIGIEDFFNKQITWDQPSQNKAQARARPPSPESPPRSFDHYRNASMERGAPSLTSSNSTIRARPDGSGEITAQEHCDEGIELHEAGELTKSTYHLRLAARAGLPEAMFWYGLACRHGWGMRENKTEALLWLRRAVDSGQLEVADDEEQTKHGHSTDQVKRKLHRAQYAVAIYELGKCYLNGWGTAQDKLAALRCYEIAGNWGDADALVEAGYCYAEGVGCRKDLKKAAKFYRAAEAKGVSMVGNSWYVF